MHAWTKPSKHFLGHACRIRCSFDLLHFADPTCDMPNGSFDFDACRVGVPPLASPWQKHSTVHQTQQDRWHFWALRLLRNWNSTAKPSRKKSNYISKRYADSKGSWGAISALSFQCVTSCVKQSRAAIKSHPVASRLNLFPVKNTYKSYLLQYSCNLKLLAHWEATCGHGVGMHFFEDVGPVQIRCHSSRNNQPTKMIQKHDNWKWIEIKWHQEHSRAYVDTSIIFGRSHWISQITIRCYKLL